MEEKKLTDHVQNVCKIGQGAACCKYLVMGTKGFECLKVTEWGKDLIDDNWVKTVHVSQGDNCDGVKDFKILNN